MADDPLAAARKALEKAHGLISRWCPDDCLHCQRAKSAIDAAVRKALEAAAALLEPTSHPPGGGVDTGRIWTFGTLSKVNTAILALRDEVLGK